MVDHTNNHNLGTPTKADAPAPAPTRRVKALTGAMQWRHLLAEEDLRCERTGFQAGVISIDHGPSHAVGIDNVSSDAADARTNKIVNLLQDQLEFTNRVGVLSPHEISVLIIPVADVGATERCANAIDAALRSVGIHAAIGFALRRQDGNGILGAAARADACAAVAHSRQLRLSV